MIRTSIFDTKTQKWTDKTSRREKEIVWPQLSGSDKSKKLSKNENNFDGEGRG